MAIRKLWLSRILCSLRVLTIHPVWLNLSRERNDTGLIMFRSDTFSEFETPINPFLGYSASDIFEFV